MNSTSIIILAAGRGTRIKSALPKVLHPIAGKPILQWLIETSLQLKPNNIYIVYGHGGEQVKKALQTFPVHFVEQKEQLGTAHAVKQALPLIKNTERVLILVGDTPLISLSTLQKLINTPKNSIGLLTVNLADPTGLGRILRNTEQSIIGIVEEKEALPEQKKIQEINTGIMILPVKKLQPWLAKIKNNNSKNEYYLTDIFKIAMEENCKIYTVKPENKEEVSSVNDRAQLSNLERYKQMKTAKELMLQGVSLLDPQRFDLRGELEIGADVTIDVNVIIEGKVKIGNRCYIGSHVILCDSILGDDVVIKSHCHIEGTTIEKHCEIGPFARLRPGTVLKEKVKIGNFVEIKNSTLDLESKANHLAYVGDSKVGSHVNIGAGTITANYDGINKWQTIIEDGASIGANVVLVAPVIIRKNATIGAGSVINKEAPAEELTLSRARQQTIKGWKRPTKKKN